MKYFYVSFSGFRYQQIPQSSEIPNEAIQMMGIKDKKIPVPVKGYQILESDKEMFLPSLFSAIIKQTQNVQDCVIEFVREMTKEEFDYDGQFVEELSKPPQISYAVQEELDQLIKSAENGKLNINVNPNSEKQDDDEFGGLFKKPKGWN